MHIPEKIRDWTVGGFINAGKSARVYHARRGSESAAIKIFDPLIVERYGREVQLARVQRELSLLGLHHPNLVRIIDGGDCPSSGLIFVVMELIDSPNLATVLPDVPRDRIWPIMTQLAAASRFLEENGLVHRDIKPDNVAISGDFSHCTLLDLGVLRPVGIADITDETQRYFIGTLRYSAPEFLLREEKDTPEGWRAVTFYQLGAVLHDLIMRRRLFGDIMEPYARLVQAVERDIPSITASDVQADLVFLARNCLQKRPDLRLDLVTWKSFEIPPPKVSRTADLKERIRHRRVPPAEGFGSQEAEERNQVVRQRAADLQSQIQSTIRRDCVGSGLFPPVKIVGVQDESPENACTVVFVAASAAHSIKAPLHLWVHLTVLDAASGAIQLGAWASISNNYSDTEIPKPPGVRTIFRGVYDEALVRPVLQQLLYSALDEAQQLAAEPEGLGDLDRWLTLSTMDVLGDLS